MASINPIETLTSTLKTERKTLSEYQIAHIHGTIQYLKDLKKDFAGAKRDYAKTMKGLNT